MLTTPNPIRMDYASDSFDEQIIISQDSHINEVMQMSFDEPFAQWLHEEFPENLSTTTFDTNHSMCNNINNSDTSIIDKNNDIFQGVNTVDVNINFSQNINNQSLDNFHNELVIPDVDLSRECSNDIPMMSDQDVQIGNLDFLAQNNNNLSPLSSLLSSSSIIFKTMKPNDSTLISAIANDPSQSSHRAMAADPSPDPSVNQADNITDYDSSFTIYNDLDRPTIAKLCQFNVEIPSVSSRRQPIRLNTKSLAITSWTNVSKDVVMKYIKEEFDIKNIQYIGIGEEINELNHQNQLCIQIIFKEKINKKTRFLDKITRTCCNYKVTQNILAWNDYIKKDPNCLEFGQFPSKIRGYKQYPTLEVTEKQNTTRKKAAKAKAATKKVAKTKATTKKPPASCISIPLD
ncbi:unnamed protein product [Rotaria sordida]|uniref:Uncharacterized protein n=2 Tax=Rotaria sordida TaxID=392033 RepID=A0A816AH93_9BILA|nr:unnamed protein product [Rotaria sordida]CAF1597464.1 unnamed protein product [Rotaria sordida]CAF1597478.1 unnamed protein product [Rotaria sordida]